MDIWRKPETWPKPPIGSVSLLDAANRAGRVMHGDEWRPYEAVTPPPPMPWPRWIGPLSETEQAQYDGTFAIKPTPEFARVCKLIATECEAGKIAAAYQSVTGGAVDLDRSVWRLPGWLNYFCAGTIDLDLPLLDPHTGRPHPQGFTAKCTRHIFLRAADFDRLIETLPKHKPAGVALPSGQRGPRTRKTEAVAQRMQAAIDAGKMTRAELAAKQHKTLATTYGVSRDTAVKARNLVLQIPAK